MSQHSYNISDQVISIGSRPIKWKEVISLGILNMAIAISWIAYVEYQPVLLQTYQLEHFTGWLIGVKAILLIGMPALAGWVADRNLNHNRKFFTVYIVGINVTAMIFMLVATFSGIGIEYFPVVLLPILVILWLAGMAVFIAPAFSMLSTFADKRQLPLAMGVIILLTDMIYAMEPLVVNLVRFLGETGTFVTGGILVLGSGLWFYRITANEVQERVVRTARARSTRTEWRTVLVVGLLLGVGRAFLVEYIPWQSPVSAINGKEFSFILLGFAALIAFMSGGVVIQAGIRKVLNYASGLMLLGIVILIVCGPNSLLFISGSFLLAVGFAVMNVSGLPYLFSRISVRHITFAVGVFLGATALTEGVFEILAWAL
jgi:MFS family permease